MSVRSKQGKLLESDYLNNLGSTDRGDVLQVNGVVAALIKSGYTLISEAQKNLNKDGSTASGGLEKSMSVENLRVDGSSYSVDVMIADRHIFINKGVKGVEGGTGKYQFKTKYPNKKMATSILKWLGTTRRKATSIRKPLGGKTEEKNLRNRKLVNKADNLKGLAYAISTNIKKRGIRPTFFWDKALKKMEQVWAEEIKKGLQKDVILSIENINKEINKK